MIWQGMVLGLLLVLGIAVASIPFRGPDRFGVIEGLLVILAGAVTAFVPLALVVSR